jgi:hypothetical protein
MSCPFTGAKSGAAPAEVANKTEEVPVANGCPLEDKASRRPAAGGIDIDEIDADSPSLAEYKKLKRVMGIMTQFYKDGTALKQGHYDHVTEQLEKLDVDLKMAKEQLETVSVPSFVNHPKQKEYIKDLTEEIERLTKQRELFTTKQKDYKELAEWSQGIVRVCDWLELNLDDYCSKTLDYPKLKDAQKPPVLDRETALVYSSGLDEIYHNLEESQDFFEASVDGRLNKYHTQEKELIEAQLAVVRKYPETSDRRKHVEAELTQDLEFVKGNMVETPDAARRREKMLEAHADFFKVLKFHKEKLKVLYIEESTDAQKREFDPRFDHFH